MKKIVSVSLGSSRRNHKVTARFLNEEFSIERIGTDGDFNKAMQTLKDLDGNVDAIGLGGVDIYLYTRNNRFALRDGLKLKDAVKKTPVVDGSGLKNTLEREVVKFLASETSLNIPQMKILMVSAVDRFGMAQAFNELNCKIIYGDLIFALGLDRPIDNLPELEEYAEKVLPDICKMPIGFLYPIGKKQEEKPDEKYTKYYQEADLIAGDYHFIRKYMPSDMTGKIILTNTVTAEDIDDLKTRKAKYLITTTPEFEGRSFGTNVIEAVFIVILQKSWEEIKPEDYLELIKKLDLKPRIIEL